MINIENYRAIVENAPEGATHYSNEHYYRMEGIRVYWWNLSKVWSVAISNVEDLFLANPDSLTRLKQIIDQQDEIESLRKRIEEPQGLREFIVLEQMKDIPLAELNRALQKLHDELQAKDKRIGELESALSNLFKGFRYYQAMSLEEKVELQKSAEEALNNE